MSALVVSAIHAWTLGVAALCAVACAVPGSFLVLRRQALLGDAISHAILPGIAGAFILTGTRDPFAMLLGAMAVGALTAVLTETLRRWGRVPEDAAMGVVFTGLFALGVLMITWAARDVDLDPGCVLYGVIELTPFDTVRIAGHDIPRAFVWLSAVLALNVALVAFFFKELTVASFDPGLSSTLGINPTIVHYGLAAVVAYTSVASFEAVGSVLVVAMLAAPGATAHLLTDRLPRMVWISAAVAVLGAVGGYLAAVWLDTSVAGAMATAVGAQFGLACLFAPRHGVLSRRIRHGLLSLRIAREDALGMLYRWHESAGVPLAHDSLPSPPPDRPALTARDIGGAIGRAVLARLAVSGLRRAGDVRRARSGELFLTVRGQSAARRIVRSHRLWEAFLNRRLGLPSDHVHEPSHRVEHFITDAMQAQLEREVGRATDPHGQRIPER